MTLWNLLATRLPPKEKAPRQDDLDVARGIGIVLVVMGHIVSAQPPQGNDWYLTLQTLIYKFHMPMLMALSGMTFALSFPAFTNAGEVLRFSGAKAFKLLVPYIFFGLLVFAGKSIAPLFLHVDRPASGAFDDLLNIILFPSGSVANFLWFIYVLMILYLIVPIALYVSGRRPTIVFLFSLALLIFPWPRELCCRLLCLICPFSCLEFFGGRRGVYGEMLIIGY